MRSGLSAVVDRYLAGLSRGGVVALSTCGVGVVSIVDYLTGYQISVSVFYLVPVTMAAWYGGRRPAVEIAALSCVGWLATDFGAGHPYENILIPLWNALVRFGVFLTNGLLVASLRESLRRQRELARTDDLTGVFGRRAFEERLALDLERSRRIQLPLTLALVDLDDFKSVNDAHGHPQGDEVLRKTAQALKNVTRRADTVARLGGDEFALVLPDTSRRGAEEVVERLVRELRDVTSMLGFKVTCSIGVIIYETTPASIEEAVRGADARLYDAKRAGKNRVEFYVVSRAGVEPTVAKPR